MFDGNTPVLDGFWYNPKTGDSFKVRDTFFEDNNLAIMTTDGRRMDYNMISEYIKGDPKDLETIKRVEPKKTVATQIPKSIMDEVISTQSSDDYNDFIVDEDKQLLNGNIYENKKEKMSELPLVTAHNHQVVEDEDTLLIRRLLKKAAVPSVICNIMWQKFPAKQIEMLDMMGVEPSKIADYIMKDIDLDVIREHVKKEILEDIENKLSRENDNEIIVDVQQEPLIVEECVPEAEQIIAAVEYAKEKKHGLNVKKSVSKTTKKTKKK